MWLQASELRTLLILLGDKIPDAYEQLVDICQKLEAHFKDMQDIEFTIQEGKLYMLQTRTGKAHSCRSREDRN